MRGVRVHQINRDTVIQIALGSEVLLELAQPGFKLMGKFVGLEAAKYVILQMALPEGFIATTALESSITCRYLHNGSVYGFKSAIIAELFFPARLVFVSYPDSIDEHLTRCSSRIECAVPATAQLDGEEFEAMITDLSDGGCRYAVGSSRFLEILAKRADYGAPVVIKAFFQGFPAPVSFTTRLRNIVRAGETVAYGCVFDGLDEETKDALDKFMARISYIGKRAPM